MSDDISIKIDDAKVQAMFARLSGIRDLTSLMADIGETLTESTQGRFRTGTAPDGSKWKALKDGSGRTPLLKSGNMRDRITPNAASTFVQIIASARQARWHQEGTDPYVILPSANKKALSWPGAKHPARKVNHPGLPARPFMGVSNADATAITQLGAHYLDSLASGRSP